VQSIAEVMKRTVGTRVSRRAPYILISSSWRLASSNSSVWQLTNTHDHPNPRNESLRRVKRNSSTQSLAQETIRSYRRWKPFPRPDMCGLCPPSRVPVVF
jgi:hypothetical protein